MLFFPKFVAINIKITILHFLAYNYNLKLHQLITIVYVELHMCLTMYVVILFN